QYLKSYTETDPHFNTKFNAAINSLDLNNSLQYLKQESDPLFESKIQALDLNNTLQYLKSYTETDPLFDSKIQALDLNNSLQYLKQETDPHFNTKFNSAIQALDLNNTLQYLKSYTETDPLFDSKFNSAIQALDLNNSLQYLKSYTETDPLFDSKFSSAINSLDLNNSLQYLKSYTETDPLFDTKFNTAINSLDLNNSLQYLKSYTETDPHFNTKFNAAINSLDLNNSLQYLKLSSQAIQEIQSALRIKLSNSVSLSIQKGSLTDQGNTIEFPIITPDPKILISKGEFVIAGHDPKLTLVKIEKEGNDFNIEDINAIGHITLDDANNIVLDTNLVAPEIMKYYMGSRYKVPFGLWNDDNQYIADSNEDIIYEKEYPQLSGNDLLQFKAFIVFIGEQNSLAKMALQIDEAQCITSTITSNSNGDIYLFALECLTQRNGGFCSVKKVNVLQDGEVIGENIGFCEDFENPQYIRITTTYTGNNSLIAVIKNIATIIPFN
ncbi:MAG: hypothetical protein N3D73_02980, partial [Candidatus Diapherotrites archaeon]|nr:hypothetical protein [Candidatus Diapherotrites archaeon]